MLTIQELRYHAYKDSSISYLFDAKVSSFTHDRTNGYLVINGHTADDKFSFRYSITSSQGEKVVETMRILIHGNMTISILDNSIVQLMGHNGMEAVDLVSV